MWLAREGAQQQAKVLEQIASDLASGAAAALGLVLGKAGRIVSENLVPAPMRETRFWTMLREWEECDWEKADWEKAVSSTGPPKEMTVRMSFPSEDPPP